MQGLHHPHHHQQQQQYQQHFGSLLKDSLSTTELDDSTRLAALNSLHIAILYPPNSLLVTHSSSFLSQGFSQLLSDKSYLVRRSAAIAYGALSAVVCSGVVVDRFISWALPHLREVVNGDGSLELSLEAVREFLNVGDATGIERYVLPILKACQELLEDERTSLSLLHLILSVLTLVSVKFARFFQPHFGDIVDLLLGWAFIPDLSESDRGVIMDSFMQFRKHWTSNLKFSLGLLSKFMGDMDVLLKDGNPGIQQQFRRFLALLSCFLTVLQVTATEMLEMNLLEQIREPLVRMMPQLLSCLCMVGKKFGWSKSAGECWRCLTLLAEILCEKFSSFYTDAVDILFQKVSKVPFDQVHGALKTNLQLLSLQKFGVLPSSVEKFLQFESPISQLRFHPNHLVTGNSAATYLFLLQHGRDDIVSQAMTSIMDELELLKDMIVGNLVNEGHKTYSKLEIFALIKFDLKVLLSSVSIGCGVSLLAQPDIVTSYNERSRKLESFIFEKLNPMDFSIHDYVELQVVTLRTLSKLHKVEFLRKFSQTTQSDRPVDIASEKFLESKKFLDSNNFKKGPSGMIIEYLRKYNVLLVTCLNVSSPLTLKLEALQWVRSFCQVVITVNEDVESIDYFYDVCGCIGISGSLTSAVLDLASDREVKVRSDVVSLLEILLQARLIHSGHFYSIADIVLEKLGDPDSSIKKAFVRILSILLPITVYACGLFDTELAATSRPSLHWKQTFALKQLPQRLHAQHLVSILSYISLRWKVPPSSWIQRLIYSCHVSTQLEETAELEIGGPWMDTKVDKAMLGKVCSVNNLAAVWWSIHEAARYCINGRLRTNLGGPTQTFAALERMLLDIAHMLHLETEQNDGNLNIGSSGTHLLPMRLLLDFVEALKKNVYNAYDGSSNLSRPSRQSSLFFRANKKVCEEWFSRICEPMMNVGLALQCHSAAFHYCTLRLQELHNLVESAVKDKPQAQVVENFHNLRARFAGDIMRVLQHAALALCRNHEPEALVGLQKWASLTFSSLFMEENHRAFAWITGLVHQARGHYEMAAVHFSHLLQTEETLSLMGSDGVQFSIARVIESYSALSDWKSLESWLLELQTLRSAHAGKSYSGALTTTGNETNAIHALACFDEGDIHSARAYLDLTPKCSNMLTLDPKLALQRSEQMLLQAMLLRSDGKLDMAQNEIENAKSMLDEAVSILPFDGLTEGAAYSTQLHCIYAFEEGYKLKGRQEELKPLQTILCSLHRALQSPISIVHQDCNLWMKVLRTYRTVFPTSAITLQLCERLISLARKQRNFIMAHRLSNYLKDHLPRCSEERFHGLISTSLQYESILLMYAENKFEDAFTNLWSFVRPTMLSSTIPGSDTFANTFKAKACLKFSAWLKNSDMSLKGAVCKMLEDFNTSDYYGSRHLISEPSFSVIVEEIVGTSNKVSTFLCPTMGKSWLSYASWCYDQARSSLTAPNDTVLQSCLLSPVLLPEILPGRFHLMKDELSKVEDIIETLFENKINDVDGHLQNENPLKDLVHQVVNLIEVAAGLPGVEDLNGDCHSATLASQLQISFLYMHADLEKGNIMSSIDEIVSVWWSLRRRRISLFGQAAHGFMQYLSYSSSKLWEGQLANSGFNSVKQKTEKYTLRATLYILNILLNYGVELRDTLEAGLSKVPLLPWQEITPQLYARVSSHPEKVVRGQLEGLLMMLAKLSPCSVVYPTLVDVNACEGEPSEELQHILGYLGNLYPRLIQDVQLMISQLGNVTVLWEELWLSTLQDLHTDVVRRVNLLKEEATRTAENVTLSHFEKNKINAAKYSAIMAPIVVALERRLASTSRKPETPHEIWFHKEYGEQLKSAILIFKSPPVSAAALRDVWQPLAAIATSLAVYQRKSEISLGDVAPHLALLSSSEVPMPGFERKNTILESSGGPFTDLEKTVTITSFVDHVTILSTKTKPKKLIIMGSDGQKYTYLLKGREDLRLDARVMQLLQAINGFLHSSSETRSNSLAIRYYSVTPISGRAGLIQWVDSVVSIYSIFKSWQNRVQLAQLSGTNTLPPPVPRPSDMFYGKIIPALKEKGIRRVISRRDWPHEVKRKVLVDLMKETPRQLLHQEIWCASEGFKAFSLKLKRYSGSVAAMSMVGHILGLGDRHLDNVLIDFCSGDVVHIDYNVCFDKGKRLKIPEIVPFRLTQTIEAALGFTGTEGTFRANCEAVVGVLRKNKDIILMLLDVFVWDPLVEWTRGESHDEATICGEERKGMELAVSLSLFASRVQEIRVPLQDHHDLLLSTIPAIQSALLRFSDVLSQYEVVSAFFYHVDQERSNLVLREVSVKSLVAEATTNSEKTRASFELKGHDFYQAKAVVSEKAQEAAMWVEQHERVIDAFRSGTLPEVQACIKLSGLEETSSLTSAVLVAGVPLTIVPEPTQVQCNDLDREVSQLLAELDGEFSRASSALQKYALALQRVLPLNYTTTSPVHEWAQLLQLSVSTLSSDVFSLTRRQADELISKGKVDSLDSIQQRHSDLCNNVDKYVIEIKKIEEEHSELVHAISSETEAKAKDRLLSAFIKYMQSAGFSRKQNDVYSIQSRKGKHELEEKKDKVLYVLHAAASALYNEVKAKVLDILCNATEKAGWTRPEHSSDSSSGTIFSDLEEQIEKCTLIASYIGELRRVIGVDVPNISTDSEENWVSIFQTSFLSCKKLVGQMTEVLLPELIQSIVSFNSEARDAFGYLSQIRGSIDMSMEQLVDVELERASLVELEENYFVKVRLIAEQQTVLEEAAAKGRDHLSWEEAEELASQEEACRAQLDGIHQAWNQKDLRSSSLLKREHSTRNALVSSERNFLSLIRGEEGWDSSILRSKTLLATLVEPFSQLETIDRMISSFGAHGSSNVVELVTSGFSISTSSVWKVTSLLNNHSFFTWKVGIIDFFLDSCLHDIGSSVDHIDQIYNVLNRKLKTYLREHVGEYLRERVTPAFLARLEIENEHLKLFSEATKELGFDQVNRDVAAVKKVQIMLEEYCNTHETARAARSAAYLKKKQAGELKEALHKTVLEIVKMEWIHDDSVPYLNNNRDISQDIVSCDDTLYPIIMYINRSNLLDNIQSSVTLITRLVECLQACERSSVLAEGQLERAMGWACGGPNPSGSSGIPPEFHDHLAKRRQFLWEAVEQATDIIRTCTSILEFEASRDGLFRMPGEVSSGGTTREVSSGGTTREGRTWQESYLNNLTRLDVTYHSFSRAEKEWKMTQGALETSNSNLLSASNELCDASAKAKSASGDLQGSLVAMQDCAYEANMALSAFGRVARGHTALTSECGSMLEEVLAITEGLHDVHILGKEAAGVHNALMSDLSKANAVLLPLESVLSQDVAAMTAAISRYRESKMEIPPIHGQAIYQSYCLRIREAFQSLNPLVPSLTSSVKELHSLLTGLARMASLHAGNLHKALEGLGESQGVTSHDIVMSRSNLTGDATLLDNMERDHLPKLNGDNTPELLEVVESSLQDEGWISPPHSIYDTSPESSASSAETNFPEDVTRQANISKHFLREDLLSEKLQHFVVKKGRLDSASDDPSSDKGKQEGVDLEGNDERQTLDQVKEQNGILEVPSPNVDRANRTPRGKNQYALSVLKRVDMKLDGRDIESIRNIDIAEQVDYLLKQATSVDNLCNMYEGWTPWI
ncbi:hypothetical protein GIB67_007083 [Kingdonia uniflora]|uniref:non-specific serine/threonine protein kinase n=1 Tax=Kingdonia uniflora TaxID=39325 RepID=A0A7J7NZQ6_9MAGN|nr:hypothetical protein GIB67_007083 [Kingdonia uniflora]